MVLSGPTFGNANPELRSPEKVAEGRSLYREHCEICHGVNMNSTSSGAFDLRAFPPDQKQRFVASVNNGKNGMPPWRSILKPADIEALFAFVTSVRSN